MSLRLKMILGIGVVLSFVLIGYALLALRVQSERAVDTARQEAELVVNVVSQAISISMEQGKSAEIQRILERIGRENAVASVRILNADRRILRSGDPAEIGRSLSAAESAGLDRPASDDRPLRDGAVASFRRIENGPSCYGCHVPQQQTLGLLAVEIPLSASALKPARQMTSMVVGGVLGLVAAGLLIALLFSLVVGRRIDALSSSMRLVQAGDLTARAPEDAADELGRVGRGLNAMVARLAEEQRSREERHAEEIRQAEHVASLGRRATVGTITSGIAHELNNPLNNISLTVETLMEDYQSLDDKAKWQLLQDTYFQVERASEIVRSLLDFTREEKPSLEPLDLGELVQSSVRLVQNEMNIHGATLSLKLPASTPQVQGAANQLRQVFLNLFLNAIQAMPDGGAVTVTLAQPHPGRVCVLVSDEGVGIPEEAQSHVFDPFFTTKEPGAGSGLGLWVTYGIVRKHGGDIRVESEPGRGTTFHVCLPATGPSESATDAQTTAEER